MADAPVDFKDGGMVKDQVVLRDQALMVSLLPFLFLFFVVSVSPILPVSLYNLSCRMSWDNLEASSPHHHYTRAALLQCSTNIDEYETNMIESHQRAV